MTENNRVKYQREKREALRDSVEWPKFDETNTGLYPNAVECDKHPGFYYIPYTISPFLISNSGELLNLFTGQVHFADDIESNGYFRTTLRDMTGKRKTYYIHRLVADLFIPPAVMDGQEREINHKDGNNQNNKFKNLEWVTHQENIQHAIDNELTTNNRPVMAKNIQTGEITLYRSIEKCADAFDLRWQSLKLHLGSKYAGALTKKWHAFMFADAVKWPEIPEEFIAENTQGWVCDTLATNVKTGQRLLIGSINSFSKITGIHCNSIYNHLRKKGSEVPYRGWLFTHADYVTED